jgi:hypothetical protein
VKKKVLDFAATNGATYLQDYKFEIPLVAQLLAANKKSKTKTDLIFF